MIATNIDPKLAAAIDAAVGRVKDSRTRLGYDGTALHALAMLVVDCWRHDRDLTVIPDVVLRVEDRRYTVDEIDSMRDLIARRTVSYPWDDRDKLHERSVQIEHQLRTYMTNGTTPDELAMAVEAAEWERERHLFQPPRERDAYRPSELAGICPRCGEKHLGKCRSHQTTGADMALQP